MSDLLHGLLVVLGAWTAVSLTVFAGWWAACSLGAWRARRRRGRGRVA